MQLNHEFTVPVGVDDAWAVLLDIERIAPCMPGAAIDSVDGDDFTGTVKVKLGPIGLTYKGRASFVEKDVAAHRAVIDARGRDARGNGTANAKVTATLVESGGSTLVTVVTDLDITGKPAQFGRGVMVDVGNKLIGQFADCLAGKLTDSEGAGAAAASASAASSAAANGSAASGSASTPTTPTSDAVSTASSAAGSSAGTESSRAVSSAGAASAAAARPAPPRPAAAPEPINLIESAGPAVAKRLAPVVAAVVVVALLVRRRRHR